MIANPPNCQSFRPTLPAGAPGLRRWTGLSQILGRENRRGGILAAGRAARAL